MTLTIGFFDPADFDPADFDVWREIVDPVVLLQQRGAQAILAARWQAMPRPLDVNADAVALSAAALRPRGDAWRNGGSDDLAGSVMGLFFEALGVIDSAMHRRLVDLVDEFFCYTAVATLDVWRREYGMPDACDPFAVVCDKVNAVGDTTAAYAVGVAALAGWSITIREEFLTVYENGQFGRAQFGAARFACQMGVLWSIAIDAGNSAAYTAPLLRPSLFGAMAFGDRLSCSPATASLECLIRRIAPAHADLDFSVF